MIELQRANSLGSYRYPAALRYSYPKTDLPYPGKCGLCAHWAGSLLSRQDGLVRREQERGIMFLGIQPTESLPQCPRQPPRLVIDIQQETGITFLGIQPTESLPQCPRQTARLVIEIQLRHDAGYALAAAAAVQPFKPSVLFWRLTSRQWHRKQQHSLTEL